MNIDEFNEKYKGIGQKHKIVICCDVCGKENRINREKAEQNIIKHGFYIDRRCAATQSHQEKPRGEETKEKQRQGRLGKKQTEEARIKIAAAKRAYFQTPEGQVLKRKLAWLAAKGHSENKYENAKRTGWYLSGKTGDLVFYGSSYELRLCWELDKDVTVQSYDTQIEYQVEDRNRCLDCLVTFKNGYKKAIEVKPQNRMNEQANINQIDDARTYAASQGWEFELVTENTFNMTERELRDWADEFRSQMEFFDWVEFRNEQNRKKAKKHYDLKISQDKITIFCEYCKENHEPLRLTYDKNIKRNGRYICEKEGGFIAGSKPKKKKENPHAGEGKKQCVKCLQVKTFDEFGKDKDRSDGYASRCKVCRSSAAIDKYYEKVKNQNSDK